IVAWTAQARRSSTPRTIFAATGSARSAPRRAHPILTVPSGHQIDELAIAGDGAPAAPSAGPGPTIAWIESWYDRRGAYHSQVEVTDLGHAGQVRSFAIAGTIAADLSFAQDTRGDELLGWNVCDA